MKLYSSIESLFKVSFPPTSVYEFEYLKSEIEVQEVWKYSTIYVLCQRKVIFFSELDLKEGVLEGFICQRESRNKLKFKLDLRDNPKSFPTKEYFNIDLLFYKGNEKNEPPFKEVAGFKVLDNNEVFLGWYNPERLIYDYFFGKVIVEIEGDTGPFLRYKVHYVGQSKDQNIWERLTGHEKISKILATIFPLYQGEFNSYEHCILLFHFDSFKSESVLFTEEDIKISNSLLRNVKDEEAVYWENHDPKYKEMEKPMINDFEAYLINLLEPAFNVKKYKNYPNIKNGLVSQGYRKIQHEILSLYTLVTDECIIKVDVEPIFSKH